MEKKLSYDWLVKLIAASFIAVIALILVFIGYASDIIIVFSGILCMLIGLTRLPFLFKTKENKRQKLLTSIEVLLAIGVGGVLLAIGFNKVEGFSEHWIFGVLIGIVLYVRGLFYTISVAMLNAKVKKLEFWFCMICFTMGVFVSTNGVTANDVKWLIFALAVISSTYIYVDGFNSFSKYKKLRKVEPKSASDNVSKEVEEDITIIPKKDEEPAQDQIIQ